jgi:hypothetical protein
VGREKRDIREVEVVKGLNVNGLEEERSEGKREERSGGSLCRSMSSAHLGKGLGGR